ncbi:heavy-metal-associated domain-containing protein [Clostridium minihomine]|uniref:heavy-metal-associated domain-containing protein n=1 Tax=Clostridium minihomine TaxID=2045012 RepID=UPI000C78AC44|nr:heavy metal-associated domain-containing protein [Clostridium minihomine]
MKKLITIEGMHCEHCQAKAEKALNSMEGVQAKVNLKKKQATVTLSKDISDQEFEKVLQEAGYEVSSITEKKGLFG